MCCFFFISFFFLLISWVCGVYVTDSVSLNFYYFCSESNRVKTVNHKRINKENKLNRQKKINNNILYSVSVFSRLIYFCFVWDRIKYQIELKTHTPKKKIYISIEKERDRKTKKKISEMIDLCFIKFYETKHEIEKKTVPKT